MNTDPNSRKKKLIDSREKNIFKIFQISLLTTAALHFSTVQCKAAGYDNVWVKVSDFRIKSYLSCVKVSCKCDVKSFIKREQDIVTSTNPGGSSIISNPL